MMRRPAYNDQMRFGIVWSILLHVCLVVVMAFQWSSLFDLSDQQQAIQVKIVAASNAPIKKAEPKTVKPEPVFTQQSAAPAKPPEPQPLKKAEAPVMAKVETKKLPEVKKKPPEKAQPQKQEQQKRPEKLDKSKDKKPVLKDEEAKPKPKSNDDFLKAMSFIENLKDEASDEPAAQEGEDDAPLLLADMEEIGRIKKHISNNWLKPSGTKGEHQVSIEIRINRDGTLRDARIIKSSGAAFFDNSLLRAVRKSEPIPYPSDKYDKFKVMEIIWNG